MTDSDPLVEEEVVVGEGQLSGVTVLVLTENNNNINREYFNKLVRG